ncbi:MAG: type II toxin-antitoxin system MqsA family antitoxin [Spirochaetaceae bacterium]|nr:type II toxin-antitoxin system MqsA family antitoxin [Spirochaetaceae bacterium]
MNCFFCKGSLTDGTTTFMTEIDGCAVIIKNVPAKVCSQCGEASFSDEVAKKLEQIVDSLRTSLTEVAIADYRSAA